MEEVYSAPYDELPLQNDRFAGNCTDLSLGHKGITQLQGFEKFITLSTIWLNDNKLQSIEGLEENIRLKGIHLYSNKIRKLKRRSFLPFKFLAVLTLNDNLLEDIDSTLRELKILKNLKSLDLFDNPIAEEDNYRLRVLSVLPSLEIFDRHRITDDEKIELKIFKEKMKKLKHFNINSSSPLGKKTKKIKNDESTKLKNLVLKDIISFLRKKVEARRCFLELSFFDVDRRSLGIIKEGIFWNILHEYGLSQILSDSEKDILNDKYRIKAEVLSISKTGTLPRPSINYHKFCLDILPVPLRVAHEPDWRLKIPEVSVTSRDLQQYVKTVKAFKVSEELETKKRLMLSINHNEKSAVFSTNRSDGNSGLSVWDLVELSKLINYEESGGKKSGDGPKKNVKSASASEKESGLGPGLGLGLGLDWNQCERIFRGMTHQCKIPVCGINSALDLLFNHGCDSSLAVEVLRASIGCPQRSASSTSRPIVSASKIRIDSSPTTTPEMTLDYLYKNPPIRWRGLTNSELIDLGIELTKTERLNTEKDRPGSFSESLHSSIRVAARKTQKPVLKDYYNPDEVTATAGRRADLIVLPNLKVSIQRAQSAKSLFSTDSISKTTNNSSNKYSKPVKGWASGTTTLII